LSCGRKQLREECNIDVGGDCLINRRKFCLRGRNWREEGGLITNTLKGFRAFIGGNKDLEFNENFRILQKVLKKRFEFI
jgi:hypothetical protein